MKDKSKADGDKVYSSDSEQSDKGDDEEVGGTNKYKSADPKVKSTQMDLRIREDVAKYLLNRDPNSAFYDPKSRSLKEDPGAKNSKFKGDNYVKISGEYLNLIENEGLMNEMNRRAEASGSTQMANTVAMPTHFEMLKKELHKRKLEMEEMHKE